MPQYHHDHTGSRFGRLTAVCPSHTEARPDGLLKTIWICRCECGDEGHYDIHALLTGRYKSCGCVAKSVFDQAQEAMALHIEECGYQGEIQRDRTDETVGRLTVVRYVAHTKTETGKRRSWWLCRCECGNERLARGDMLASGQIKSCGCLYLDRARKNKPKRADGKLKKPKAS